MKKELRKALCFLLCVIAVISCANAQDEYGTKLPDLIPYRKADKWGYCDRKKKIVISPDFEEADLFGVVPGQPYFDFPDSIAWVKKDNKQFWLSKSGKLMLPGNTQFPGGDMIGVSDRGIEQVKTVKKTFNDPITGKVGLLGKNGLNIYDTLIPARFEDIEPNLFFDSMDYIKVREKGKWGIMLATSQKWLLKPAYDDIEWCGQFEKNGIPCQTYRVKDKAQYGFFIGDKLVLPARYKEIRLSEKTVLIVSTDAGKGLVDFNGKTLTTEFFEEIDIWGFDNSTCTPVKKNGKWGLLNIRGKLVAPCKYDECSKNISKWGLCWVTYKGKKGLIDIKGTEYFED